MNKKVLFLSSHPIQYMAPMYQYFDKNTNLDIEVMYCTNVGVRESYDEGFGEKISWDIDLLKDYSNKFIGSKYDKLELGGFFSLICPSVVYEIIKSKPDYLVIHGTQYAVNVIATITAKITGVKVLHRCETHLFLSRPKLKKALRNLCLRLFYMFIDGFLSIGTRNRNYYKSLGVPERKIYSCPYAVDNDRFIGKSVLSETERNILLQEYDLPINKPIVVFASKLTRGKSPDDLLFCAEALNKKGIDFHLLIVGSGEMYDELIKLKNRLKINNISMLGFLNQTEMPKVFGISDIFVLTSKSDTWGLVVNEAMCAGLPVVVGEEMGCTDDLVISGVNGYKVKPGDIEYLTSVIGGLLTNPELLKKMKRESKNIISKWNYSVCAEGLELACNQN